MSDVIKYHKVVASLPGTLEPNSVYYVRVGAGFDMYVTNDIGLVSAYQLNPVASGMLSNNYRYIETGDVLHLQRYTGGTWSTVHTTDASGNVTIAGNTLTVASVGVSLEGHTHSFASLTSKPTTLSGYGITDAVAASAYTASDVLTKLLTVDGAGSGLDADLLDGQSGSYYLNASNINAGTLSASFIPILNQNTTGNAATATKLATPRTINGVSFDGSANITIQDSSKEPAISSGTAVQFWRGDKAWTDFNTTVRAATLTGLSTATSAVISATDSVLTAFGKLQAQISAGGGRVINVTSTTTTAPVTFADIKVGRVMEFEWAPTGTSNAVVAADFIQQIINTANGNTVGSSHSVGMFVYQLVKGGGSTITNFSHEMRFGVIEGTSANQMVGIKYVMDEDTAANGTVGTVVLEEITHQNNSNWFGKLERRFLDPRIVTTHAGGTIFTPTTITGNYTFTNADSGKHFLYYASGAAVLTIPDTLTPGFTVQVTQGSTGSVSLVTTGGIAMYNVGGRYATSYIGDVASITLHQLGYVGVDFVGQATQLATPRTINGVSFDGTANITIQDGSKEPVVSAGTTSQFWRGDKAWTDFNTTVRAATLTGLSTATNAVISASDTVLSAFGKLQAQISAAGGGDSLPLSGGTMTGALNEAAYVTIPAAATVDAAAAASNTVIVSGTAAISSIGSGTGGMIRRLAFNAAATLVHSASVLTLPGSANISVEAGDAAEFLCIANTWWRCISYTRASGLDLIPDTSPSAAVAISSGALNLSSASGSVVVTLNQNVTSITLPAGVPNARKDFTLQFTQDATGGRTVAGWPSSSTLQWAGGMAPSINTAAGAVTQLNFVNINNTVWIGYSNFVTSGQPLFRIPTSARLVASAVGGTALSTLALTAARAYFIPFIAPRRMTLTAVGVSVSTASAGTGTIGLFATDGNALYDYPGTLLATTTTGAINTGTTGTKTAALVYTLEPGQRCFFGFINSSAATVRAVAIAGQATTLGFTDNSTTVISAYYKAGSTNVLPVNSTVPTLLAGAAIPAIYLIE